MECLIPTYLKVIYGIIHLHIWTREGIMLEPTTAGLSVGGIILFLITLYFVIKWAVKNGINQSMLFSDDDRKKKYEEDMKKIDDELKKK
jgi:hypothetical protein